MLLKTLDVLSDDQIDDARRLYETCMAPLEILAAQRHMMTTDEFTEQMLQPAITKGLVYDDEGNLTVAGAYATDLTAVGLLSWKFFRHHWPDQYAQQKIFYIAWLASSGTTFRGYRTFVEHIYSLAAPVKGLVGMDVCTENILRRGFASALDRTTKSLSHGRSHYVAVDAQTFLLYDVTGGVLDPFTGEPLDLVEATA